MNVQEADPQQYAAGGGRWGIVRSGGADFVAGACDGQRGRARQEEEDTNHIPRRDGGAGQ